jgi:hypothetical protein
MRNQPNKPQSAYQSNKQYNQDFGFPQDSQSNQQRGGRKQYDRAEERKEVATEEGDDQF